MPLPQNDESDRTRAMAALLLLPAAALVIPALLAFDPLPQATAAGWIVLLALPLLAVLVARARTGLPPALAALGALGLLALASTLTGPTTDTFEAGRARLVLLIAGTGLLAGHVLTARGRELLATGLSALSLALTAPALGSYLAGGELGLAGALGNTGSLSLAALPGAVLGAVAATRGTVGPRLLGVLAAVSFALHAALAPSLTGLVAFGLALASIAWRDRHRARPAALLALTLALLGPVLWVSAPALARDAAPAPEQELARDTGGGEVRLRVWRATVGLALEHPLLGAGPGQFRATFPPHRDPLELELSTRDRAGGSTTEVEHPHADVVLVLAELGLPGLLVFLAALASLGLAAIRRLGADDTTDRAFGAAGLAVLTSGLLHVPLTYEPLPALLGWATLGVCSASARALVPPAGAGRVAAALLLVLAVGSAGTALGLVRHGAALAERQALAAEPDGAAADEEGRLLRRALEAAEDSALATTLLAQRTQRSGASAQIRSRARELWRRVLELRPFQASALLNLGLLTDDSEERRTLWTRVLAIDPFHPVLRENLARFELFEGDPGAAFEHLDALERGGRLTEPLLLELGARALIAGRSGAGLELLGRADERFVRAYPEELFAEADALRGADGSELVADGLEAAAHRLWALELLQEGEPGFAAAKLRQALRVTRRYLAEGDAPTRLLLAGALAQGGEDAAAREALAELGPQATRTVDSSDWPAATRQALERLADEADPRLDF